MISVDFRDARPLYEQVIDGFVKLIAAGVLAPEDKLPSVRSLATQLVINPNTIQRAYRELEAQGYIYSVQGRGSFVASIDAAAAHKAELLGQFDALVAELRAVGCDADELIRRVKGGEDR